MHKKWQLSAAHNPVCNGETMDNLQNPHSPSRWFHIGFNYLPVLAIPEITVNIAFSPVEDKYNTDYTVQNVKRQSQIQAQAYRWQDIWQISASRTEIYIDIVNDTLTIRIKLQSKIYIILVSLKYSMSFKC